jgi:hypothetical protein
MPPTCGKRLLALLTVRGSNRGLLRSLRGLLNKLAVFGEVSTKAKVAKVNVRATGVHLHAEDVQVISMPVIKENVNGARAKYS